MNKSIFIFAAALAAFVGCSNFLSSSDIPNTYTIKGEVASITTSSKVAAIDITANTIEFKWEYGDVVAYVAGTEEEPSIVMATCTDPENKVFEMYDPAGILKEGEEYDVMYPLPDENLLPTANEERRNGNIGSKHIITGHGDLSGFRLTEHMPLVHLPVNGSGVLGRIELRPYSDGEYTLYFGTIHTCKAPGVTLGNDPVDFYISLNSADTSEGKAKFNIKIYDTEDRLVYDQNCSADLEGMNQLIDMPCITIGS